jgi:hypothetical protein
MSEPNYEAAIDALLTYWLTGTDDPEMAEWWASADAPQVAAEVVKVVADALTEEPE